MFHANRDLVLDGHSEEDGGWDLEVGRRGWTAAGDVAAGACDGLMKEHVRVLRGVARELDFEIAIEPGLTETCLRQGRPTAMGPNECQKNIRSWPADTTCVSQRGLPTASCAREGSGAPGEIRTPDLLLRRQSLYPAELRARTVDDTTGIASTQVSKARPRHPA
jgi:hypothetical protein